MTMALDRLVADHLDIWTDAMERKSGAGRAGGKRVSLYGIERLRALILDLAVRGKLVPQDARDEPASKLLTRIFAERKALQQAGKMSKPKKLPAVGPDELKAPQSWAVIRFGDVFSFEYGDNLPEPKRSGTGEYNVFGSNGVVGTHHSYSIEQPCLVVGRKGSAGAINRSYKPCWVTDVAYYCVPPSGIDLEFQYTLFRTLGLDELGKGIKPGLNRNEANVLAIALPPLPEQRRIVAKVDELMALCDALERGSVEAMAAHQTLVETLLATLVSATDSADLARQWTRLELHFDTLLVTEASIDALKQAILDLAVRGKLVEHEGISEWTVAALGNLIGPMDSGWSPACLAFPARADEDWGILKTTAVQRLEYRQDQNKELPDTLQPRPDAECRAGDVLITRAGPTNRVGICCYVPHTRPRLMISDKIVRFRPISDKIDGAFLALALSIGPAADQIEKAKSGMAASQMNISQAKLRAVIVSYWSRKRRTWTYRSLVLPKRRSSTRRAAMSRCRSVTAKVRPGRFRFWPIAA